VARRRLIEKLIKTDVRDEHFFNAVKIQLWLLLEEHRIDVSAISVRRDPTVLGSVNKMRTRCFGASKGCHDAGSEARPRHQLPKAAGQMHCIERRVDCRCHVATTAHRTAAIAVMTSFAV